MRANAHIGIYQRDQPNLSAHAYYKSMRVSCNIADLIGDDKVGHAALAEAVAYRAMLLLA
jgi:predicted ATPase with chaperone activity